MIGSVGYAVSLVPACEVLYVSYLEADMLAWDTLHHPSQVHLRHNEVVDRIEAIVAWGPKSAELQHTAVKEPLNPYSVIYHRTLTSPDPSLSMQASQDKP